MTGKFLLKLLLLIFINSLAINLYSQQTATLKEIAIHSKILNQKRPIYIYVPTGYNERDLVSFDVIYVFDAQNREIFDLVHSLSNFIFLKKKFIVVGVSSPSYDDIKYYRNYDFLPKPINVPINKYQADKPNAENFWSYFNDEVIPFVNSNYRTTNVNYLVGHSLGASFVLDKAINAEASFKGFICVSPNFGYDNERLANDFLKADFNKATEKKFLYISQSNEATTFPKNWGEAYGKVKKFVDSTQTFGQYQVAVKEFPEYSHWQGFVPSVTYGLGELSKFIEQNPYAPKGNAREINFKISVPDKNDVLYIVGNQEGLGNWNPSKIRFKKISELEREITLNVRFPIEFKLTKGSWETEGFTNQSSNSGENIVINDAKTNTLSLKVISWNE